MFDSYYSTKDICQIFNIGRETLRHYEKLGLLKPHVNPSNGYRQYDYWDICIIIEILRYRSYGLSLSDTKKALFELDFNDIIVALEEHTDLYTKELIKYELLLKKAQRDLYYLRHAKEHLNKLIETEVPNLFFIPFTTDPSSEYFAPMRTTFDNSRFFTTAIIFDYSDQISAREGQLTDKGYADFLGITNGVSISASKAACKMINLEGAVQFNESITNDFRDEISDKYSRTFDTIHVALVTRFFNAEKNLQQYYLLFALLD